jgi:hypothetical protein
VLAQKTAFDYVKIRRPRSANSRLLVDKLGKLTFDDTARKFLFESDADDHIEAGYEDIEKVVFEVTSHMRGGAASEVVGAARLPGIFVGNMIGSAHVHSYWFYLEYKDRDRVQPVLLEVPKGSSTQIINRAASLFGSRVTVTDFPEKEFRSIRKTLRCASRGQVLKVNKSHHPEPETKADKATVVVVCPAVAARFAGKGTWFRLHATDQVIAVNRMGTYGLASLAPGKYRLASEAANANGFEMGARSRT